jgi:hypothetical protein
MRGRDRERECDLSAETGSEYQYRLATRQDDGNEDRDNANLPAPPPSRMRGTSLIRVSTMSSTNTKSDTHRTTAKAGEGRVVIGFQVNLSLYVFLPCLMIRDGSYVHNLVFCNIYIYRDGSRSHRDW